MYESIWNNYETHYPIITYPILLHADESKSYTLYCDASGHAIGCILSQLYEKGEYVV